MQSLKMPDRPSVYKFFIVVKLLYRRMIDTEFLVYDFQSLQIWHTGINLM